MFDIKILPSLNAVLNTTSAIFLALGFYFIKRKDQRRHAICMLSAVATSTLFLISYLYYHAHAGVTRYQGTGLLRKIYFTILSTHTVLAAVIVPLVLMALYRAWRERYAEHAKIARWTWPVWMYVSVTGVMIYAILYHT